MDPHPEHPIALPLPESVGHLLNLVDCVCTLLETQGAGKTCWCGLYPGSEVSHEYCTECSDDVCGMGYVRLSLGSPYEIFPAPAIDDRCSLPLMWGVEVGALRCFPSEPDGSTIDPSTSAEVALKQILDARALRAAIKCCSGKWGLGAWTPYGPLGGCVGGYWTAFLSEY